MKNYFAHKPLPYLRQFKLGVVWTFIDSFGSQGLVIIYHLVFRTLSGELLHGALSCLLSLTYLASTIANLGLDKTVAPFLEFFIQSKKRLSLFMILLVVPQILFLCFLSAVFAFTITYSTQTLAEKLPILSSLLRYFTFNIVLFTILTFLLESLRKTLRTFLQLSFYFRICAAIEWFGIIGNILSIITLSYFGSLTLESAWRSLACFAAAQVVLLLGAMGHLYHTLPRLEVDHVPLMPLYLRITKTRVFSWILQCFSQMYSGNFLVPVCALQFGIASASLMKVISSISYWITILGKNVFGISSNALLAHIKSQSSATQTEAFHYLSDVFSQGLYALGIFLLINGHSLALLQMNAPATVTWSLLYFMLLLTFFENFFVLYEKWYILEEDAFLYVALNMASIALLYWLTPLFTSPVTILSTILLVRIVTYILLVIVSSYRWNIIPALKPRALTIVGSLMFSTVFHLILSR